ncbi:MAG: pseudouridine synthase, partial [Methanomicrobiales archaeon]
MSLFDIRRRDCLAREGTFSREGYSVRTPGIIDIPDVFPGLDGETGTNVPLSADAEFVSRYHHPGTESPVVVHPLGREEVSPGDLVIVANWQTTLSRPRDFVRYLVSLKGRLPPDTAWYAPASALPSNAALLAYVGFDLFDACAVDLATVRGYFCTPEGILPEDLTGAGVCGCEGCLSGDIGRHNRIALERELALVRRFIAESRLRDLVEARCRSDPDQVAILRLLDREESFLEPYTPVA